MGQALGDPDFVGGSDEITYTVDITGFAGPFTITAELLYQSVALSSVEDLRGEDAPLTTRFVGYFDDADKTPIAITSAEFIHVVQ